MNTGVIGLLRVSLHYCANLEMRCFVWEFIVNQQQLTTEILAKTVWKIYWWHRRNWCQLSPSPRSLSGDRYSDWGTLWYPERPSGNGILIRPWGLRKSGKDNDNDNMRMFSASLSDCLWNPPVTGTVTWLLQCTWSNRDDIVKTA